MNEIDADNKIKITVNFTGLIDIKKINSGSELTLNNDMNISALLSELGIKEHHKKYLVIMANGKKETLYYNLKNNDEVSLFLPVGGG